HVYIRRGADGLHRDSAEDLYGVHVPFRDTDGVPDDIQCAWKGSGVDRCRGDEEVCPFDPAHLHYAADHKVRSDVGCIYGGTDRGPVRCDVYGYPVYGPV